MDILIIFIGIVLLIILIIIVYKVVKASQVVPQEERLVIYRLGRFNRIAGPGLVWLIPGLEEARRINVRERPLEITVPQIFAFGVSNVLTLNLWCSFDLKEATGGNKEKLTKLVQLSESERRQQLEVKIREALVQQVSDLQKRKPLRDGATTLDGVVALAPGSDRNNELLAGITRDLKQSLPSIGVILSTDQPITLTGRGIPEAIIAAIQRKYGRDIDSEWLTRYAGNLRNDFPEIPTAVLAQVLSAIEGVDAGQVQRLLLEQEGKGAVETEVEFEMSGDGTRSPKIIAKPGVKGREAEVEPPAATPEMAETPPHLTERDLSVLKRIPRGERSERKSA
ncbi:MAG: SPFH domain-containing protein [Chloroflexota bacterium]